ncbi:hypothetical protein ACFQ0B_76505 [Nonomuraea thailandensis]
MLAPGTDLVGTPVGVLRVLRPAGGGGGLLGRAAHPRGRLAAAGGAGREVHRDQRGLRLRSRYRILESLRQYGHHRLTKNEATSELRRRHAEYYQSLAERNKDGWFGPDQLECYITVSLELPNLRTALDYYLGDDPRVEEAIRMFTSLYGYWTFFGGPAEARHWFNRLLEHKQIPPRARFDVLAVGVHFALMQGRRDIAQPLIEECRSLADDSGSHEATAMGKFLSGRLALMKGEYQEAVSLLDPAVKWYEHHLGETLPTESCETRSCRRSP